MRKPVFTLTLIATVAAAITLAVAADSVADIKKADADWNSAAQGKNVEQFLSFIGHDAYMSGPDGKWIHGKEAARSMWSSMLADPNFKLSWTAESADVSKDATLGYTRGTYQGTLGGKPMSGVYSTVWKKQTDGKWRVAVDIASPAGQ